MNKHDSLKDLPWLLLLIFSLIPILTLSPRAAEAAKRYLPLVVKEPSTPTPTTRLVLFEGFYSPTWGHCQTAGPVVDQLAQDYTGKPVVFLEYPVSGAPVSRYDIFKVAHGPGSMGFPLVMVDSGHQFTEGPFPSYYNTYKGLVDQELPRQPQAEVQATWQRTGNKVSFSIQIKNQSGVALSYAQNKATVHAIVYEDKKVGVTSRYVRSTVPQNITTSLAPGASATFNLETPDLTGVDWNKLHYLALVDHQPVSGSAYDTLQAAVALPTVSENPED